MPQCRRRCDMLKHHHCPLSINAKHRVKIYNHAQVMLTSLHVTILEKEKKHTKKQNWIVEKDLKFVLVVFFFNLHHMYILNLKSLNRISWNFVVYKEFVRKFAKLLQSMMLLKYSWTLNLIIVFGWRRI